MDRSHIGSATLAALAALPWMFLGVMESGVIGARIAHPAIVASGLTAVAALGIWSLFQIRRIRAYATIDHESLSP